ncbi:MAG: ribosome silencing factor [Sediminibacterium sp.]|nr:ribosome silencing factor [Sediminibacterium sp.]
MKNKKTPATNIPVSQQKPLTRNSKIFKTIIDAIFNKKGTDIVSLDFKDNPDFYTQFLIICSADNLMQIKAIAEEIEKETKENVKERPFRKEISKQPQWVILDYVNIIIHIMHPEVRNYYNLELMWNDIKRIEHNPKLI